MNISFAGCGFLGMYHVGVASCIMQHAPHLQFQRVGGASAGAMSAAMLIMGCDLRECTDSVLRLATQARKRRLGPLHPSFRIVKIIREGMRRIFPANAHEITSGRLCVSVTRVCDGGNAILDRFETREELIQALICSAFVPVYCGLVPPMFKGTRYVDGGLSDNCPNLGKNTITVSPFSGEADICPRDPLSNNLMNFSLTNTSIQFTTTNMWRMAIAFFPPEPEVLQEICKQGFNDALRFLRENDLIGCMRHVSSVRSMSEVGVSETTRSVSECSSDSNSEVFLEEDEEAGEEAAADGREQCSECKSEIHHALLQTLPPQVSVVFQEACRKGFLHSILNGYTASFVSLVTLPYILPLETAYNYTLRFAEWAPEETAYYLRKLLKHLESHLDVQAGQVKDRVLEMWGSKSNCSQRLKDCRLVTFLQQLLQQLERRGVFSRTHPGTFHSDSMAESSPLAIEYSSDTDVPNEDPTFRYHPHFYLSDILDYSETWSHTEDLDSLVGYVETVDYVLHRFDWIDAVTASYYIEVVSCEQENHSKTEANRVASEDEGIESSEESEVHFHAKL